LQLTGVLATAASVLGTMSRQFGFASKKDLFGLTASNYRIVISKIKFRMREMSRTKDLVPNPPTAYAEALKFQLDQVGTMNPLRPVQIQVVLVVSRAGWIRARSKSQR